MRNSPVNTSDPYSFVGLYQDTEYGGADAVFPQFHTARPPSLAYFFSETLVLFCSEVDIQFV